MKTEPCAPPRPRCMLGRVLSVTMVTISRLNKPQGRAESCLCRDMN